MTGTRPFKPGYGRLLPIAAGAMLLFSSASLAADWVRLIPRDPFAWVDLDSKRTDADGLVRVRVSLSGNPSRPHNLGMPMRFVQKAVDCRTDNAVFDIDQNGRVKRELPAVSAIDKVLTPPRDNDLDRALFLRICLKKRLNE